MTSTLFDNTRESQDRVINTFGKSLLSLWAALDLSILNGSEFGQSPVDLHIYLFMVTVWLLILLLLKKFAIYAINLTWKKMSPQHICHW